jgi:tetraacyldisaccharide 4'-kinase
LPVPVIVVGNVTIGGAGKTPLVIALVAALRELGWKPGVASRGYGGLARGPRLLGPEPDPAQVGDEPALIAIRTGAPVAIGADRPAAARLLLDEGVDLVVADDGLQHYPLARDVEICVLDGVRRLGNGRLLPAGPLRESAPRLGEVDFIVCNGGEPQAGEIPMRLAAGAAVSLVDASIRKPLATFSQTRVHAVAGIGHPQRFFDTLREYGIDVIEHPFPDHHRYVPDDLVFADDLPILMTEKDAVKCRAFGNGNWWAVPVAAELPATFVDAVAARVCGARALAATSRGGL